MRRVGETSVSLDSSGSYKIVPDKQAIEDAGAPDSVEQYVDAERGVVVLDLEGCDGDE